MNPKWTDEERAKWPYGVPPQLSNKFVPVMLERTPIHQSGVFVEIVDGRHVVSIRCRDGDDLNELKALARRIMAAIC